MVPTWAQNRAQEALPSALGASFALEAVLEAFFMLLSTPWKCPKNILTDALTRFLLFPSLWKAVQNRSQKSSKNRANMEPKTGPTWLQIAFPTRLRFMFGFMFDFCSNLVPKTTPKSIQKSCPKLPNRLTTKSRKSRKFFVIYNTIVPSAIFTSVTKP